MAMLASTVGGALGTATSSVKVFQDVDLQLHDEDWFSLVDDVSNKNVVVHSSRVGGSRFTLEPRSETSEVYDE